MVSKCLVVLRIDFSHQYATGNQKRESNMIGNCWKKKKIFFFNINQLTNQKQIYDLFLCIFIINDEDVNDCLMKNNLTSIFWFLATRTIYK